MPPTERTLGFFVEPLFDAVSVEDVGTVEDQLPVSDSLKTDGALIVVVVGIVVGEGGDGAAILRYG